MALTDKERARLNQLLDRIADGDLMTPKESEEARALMGKMGAAKKDIKSIPPCAVSMACLCAGHARGDDPSDACDTKE